jgi:integrase
VIHRRNGDAILYRWMRGGVAYSKNFPAGTPEDFIKARIAEIESQLLDEKLGIGADPEVQHRRRKSVTLRELTEWYIETALKEKLATRTVENNEYSMRLLMRWLGDESFPADDLRRKNLDEFKRYLLGNNYSGISARVTLGRIQTVFKKASYEEIVVNYPFVGFQYPKAEESPAKPILTLDEMRDIGDLFRVEPARLAWEIARFTGMRGGDVIKMQAEKIDHDSRIIEFWSAKLHRWERLPFHPRLSETLSEYRGRSGPLFSYKCDRRLSFAFREKILEYKGEGFVPCGSHTPRHSLGAYLRNVAKWQWADIRMFLCHRPQGITARYTHDDVEHLRELIERLPLDGGAA